MNKNIFLTMDLQTFAQKFNITHNEKDSGKWGDNFELLIRSAITRKATPLRSIKGQGKADLNTKRLTIDGKTYTVEIKSNCGEYNKAEQTADFVIYCPYTYGGTTIADAYLMTGAEFAEMVNGYKGLLTYDKSRDKFKMKFAWKTPDRGYIRECLGLKKTAYLMECLKKFPTLDKVLTD